MNLTPIETIATIFAAAILIKFVVLILNPTGWMNFAGKILKDTKVIMIVYLALAYIVGKYIFAAYNIIDVAAILLFGSLLYGIAFIPHSKAMFKVGKNMMRGDPLKKNWISFLIWSALAIWVLKTLFF
jgi:hypothetical protein